ncbi:LysR family transcriptional regulator [Photobacterium sp. BZF1]|uniref:LysR family transcriptional regulator n=1 Tax=Photobacterium sp. BZF1 TaxID=1904457 RepID=UPI001653BA62|nr:LysR family transcriptional regulator [Photobacterium sp. BZF1]MBC7002329.1 LysR family transcriptional regulator [Photobacterium sp. BZF1]
MTKLTDKLRRIDFNLLTSLDVLLDENNVTNAAKRLNLSQSSVSTQLAKLRDIFADPLLVPSASGRGMIASSKAKELRAPIKRILRDLDILVNEGRSFDPRTDERVFNIAISDYPLAVISHKLASRAFAELGDKVQIAFHNKTSNLNELMDKGVVDLVIASERAIPLDAKAVTLFEETFVMAQRKGHPRGAKELDIDEYCELKHLLVSTSGGSFFGYMDEQLLKHGKRRNIAMSVTQFTSVYELLKSSDYVCTLPSRLVDFYSKDLDKFELPFEASGFKLYLGWHVAYDNDPAMAWLKGFIQELFSN